MNGRMVLGEVNINSTNHDLSETQLELLDVICYQLGEWPISFHILPLQTVGEHTGWGYQGEDM